MHISGKWLARVILALIISVGAVAYLSLTNDPYNSHSTVESPFKTNISEDGSIQLNKQFEPTLSTGMGSHVLAFLRTGIRIPLYSLTKVETPLSGNETSIIEQIHAERFNPEKPYVITGGHYSDLYMRNLGVFFSGLLDPRLPGTDQDWQNRQRIALQTVAYDLAFLSQQPLAVTTIVPMGNRSFVGLNIYAPPSDSEYAVFYTLNALINNSFISNLNQFGAQKSTCAKSSNSGQVRAKNQSEAESNGTPSSSVSSPICSDDTPKQLQTIAAAQELLTNNRATLESSLNHYLQTTLDPSTGLIRTDISLSSARDGVTRQSAFYDNIIAWSTVNLADSLGVPHQPTLAKDVWKQKIIDNFWDQTEGMFKDDLSPQNQDQPAVFSADSFAVLSTGFLSPSDAQDREKLLRMIVYVRTHQLDLPFPLKYSAPDMSSNLTWGVKLFAPDYASGSIWSHWGMEYIKTEIAVADTNHSECYLALSAKDELEKYRQNIETYGGYPELYTQEGALFTSTFVHAVLHTGWVVNYEQARLMAQHSSCL